MQGMLNHWQTTYLGWGDLPDDVKKNRVKLKSKINLMGERTAIDNNNLQQLKQIVDKNLHLYLDKILLRFRIMIRKHLCDGIVNKLGYSLRVS